MPQFVQWGMTNGYYLKSNSNAGIRGREGSFYLLSFTFRAKRNSRGGG